MTPAARSASGRGPEAPADGASGTAPIAPVLEADSVGKSFGRREVLTAASLRAHPGSIVALLGRNGSGKTTLLRIVAGELAAAWGSIRIGGAVRERTRLHTMAAEGFFYLPQDGILPRATTPRTLARTVRRRIRRGAGMRTLPQAAENPPTVDAWAERWRITPLLDRPRHRLSVGERNRAGLALALLRGPLCLVADEPLTGAAPMDRALIMEMLATLRDRGCAVVVTGHEARELMELADRVVWMVAGTTHDLGPPVRARQHHQFRREYLGGGP